MGKKIVCGVTAETGCRFVAHVQIVLNFFLAVIVILALGGLPNVHITEKVVVVLMSGLPAYIIGMHFGLLLLYGTNHKFPGYLKAWLVLTVALWFWDIISISAAYANREEIQWRLLQTIIATFLYSVGLRIVYIFKREIEWEEIDIY